MEGMAEFFRVSAGLYPSQTSNNGNIADYSNGQLLAKYLQYCESLKSGFVADFNARLEAKWNTDLLEDLFLSNMEENWGEFLVSVSSSQSPSFSSSYFF